MNNLLINKQTFEKISKILTEEERIIIYKRNGLNGKVSSLRELASELNISHENVRRKEVKANYKIYKYLNSIVEVNQNNQILSSVVINKNGVLKVVQSKLERQKEIEKAYQKLKK